MSVCRQEWKPLRLVKIPQGKHTWWNEGRDQNPIVHWQLKGRQRTEKTNHRSIRIIRELWYHWSQRRSPLLFCLCCFTYIFTGDRGRRWGQGIGRLRKMVFELSGRDIWAEPEKEYYLARQRWSSRRKGIKGKGNSTHM